MSAIQESLISLAPWINRQRSIHQVPGLAICIRGEDETVMQTYGVRNVESGKKLGNDALVNIDSQTKTFTAVAILQQVERGKVNLGDKLVNLMPTFQTLLGRPELDGVTLRNALSHQTRFVPGFRSDNPKDPDRADLEAFPVSAKMFSAQNHYSNGMYALLGVLVEDVSQQSFRDYVSQHIIGKHNLGEIYTRLADVPEQERGRIPVGYFNGKKVEVPEDLETISAAGGFHATLQAVSSFYHKLANNEILPKEFVGEMFSPLNPHVLSGRNYGLGAVCCPSETGDLWGHTGAGSGDGRRSATLHSRELNLTVSVAQTRIEHENDHPNKVEQEFGCTAIIKKFLATIPMAQPAPAIRQQIDDTPSPERSRQHLTARSIPQTRTLKK